MKTGGQSMNMQSNQYDPNAYNQHMMGSDLLLAKDQTIQELKETIEILELKVKKLEQLAHLKDSKIHSLQSKMSQAGIM
eukprot:CAMPEP_0114593224 /NCGR_PEP_ID=MMETSP0125-20121206/14855_1 /TAXON_ID=485358 ORGANISM="Aristerostoma sp., Strain ATCC 50986" /NCGR_SAMPLE_ID=MMETSP0125 /ASSEMBLY_ACC=CAM_ASM_000245 /LENGTH=78 /DNA_ID=CAMNT_0001792263 /DNA_START=360 /DNA_END=596 /DNA_ORIENTATION=-